MRIPPLLLLLLASAPAPAQTTWYVQGNGTPGGSGSASNPFGSIQQGIDAAAPSGDRVLVLPGAYLENIDFRGKTLAVISQGGPGLASIEGAPPGATVSFVSGEGPGALLEGFELINTGGFQVRRRALHCDQSAAPTIRGCTIRDHYFHTSAGNPGIGVGAGLHCDKGAHPSLEDCTFLHNDASYGGAIGCEHGSSVTIHTCRFEGDRAGEGGALYLASGSSATIRQSVFHQERGINAGGAIHCEDATLGIAESLLRNNFSAKLGGAVYFLRAQGRIVRCVFDANVVNHSQDPRYGGAIYALDSNLDALDCSFAANQAIDGGGALCLQSSNAHLDRCSLVENEVRDYGGAIASWGPGSAVLRNCLIARNTAIGPGWRMPANAALTAAAGAALTLEFCTLVFNENRNPQASGGGIYVEDRALASVFNSILWGNRRGTTPEQIAFLNATVRVRTSDIEGGWAGAGNLALDPAFEDESQGDYHLRANSPCIDQADTSAGAGTGFDLDGDPYGPAQADLGCEERQGGVEHYFGGRFSAGQSLDLVARGPFGHRVFLVLAVTSLPAPVPLPPYGWWSLGAPIAILDLGFLPPAGALRFSFPLPPSAAIATLYSQALIGSQLSRIRAVVLGG